MSAPYTDNDTNFYDVALMDNLEASFTASGELIEVHFCFDDEWFEIVPKFENITVLNAKIWQRASELAQAYAKGAR